MQQWHKEEQQFLLQLQEAAEAYHTEHTAQKARREVEAKAKEEAKRQRVVEEEKRKKKMREYLQWLWDKVLEEKTALLEGAKRFRVVRSKQKEVATGDEERQWPFKKARKKYHGGAIVKMGGANTCKKYMCIGQDCLVYPSRWVINNYTYYFFKIIFFFIAAFLLVPGTSYSSSNVYPTPIPTPWPWSPLIAGF